jgi:hypothetical protein
MFPTRSLLVGGAAVLVLAAAPPALAADAVFGGTTSVGEPIVLKSDAKLAALTSAVIGWHAKCDDGSGFPGATALTPTTATPGFNPQYHDLLMSRNAKGKFAGEQLYGAGGSSTVAAVVVDVAGRLTATKASGTLSAMVKLTDAATGNSAGACSTGTLRWKASRAPGSIFGGSTSQEYPLVLRVDAARKHVSDLITSWDTHTCTPAGSYSVPEHLGNFALKSTGAFAAAWSDASPMNGGGKEGVSYQLAGRVKRTAAKGTLHVAFTDTDAAGAQTLACDSGGIAWKAATG